MSEYKCAMCKNTFEKGCSDEEALTELSENFGNISIDDCDIVCDDCYQKVKPSYMQLRAEVRLNAANVYRDLRKYSPALARSYWRMNKELEKRIINEIMYGKD